MTKVRFGMSDDEKDEEDEEDKVTIYHELSVE